MKSHRKLHFGDDGNIVNIKRPVMKCDKCYKTFKLVDNLKTHRREQHGDRIESFQCET